MSDPLMKLHRFLLELKRRKVYQVAITYGVVVLVGLEAVDLLVPATNLPGWADEFLVAVAILGFPVAVVVAWAFELTPEGVRRTTPATTEPAAEANVVRRRGLEAWMLAALLSLLVVFAVGWYVMGRGTDELSITDRSIAVLPFEALGEAEATSFTDGVHGDLLTRLSHVVDLSVISRTSVMRYRNPERPLPEIAAELGVAWVLHGEVQEIGDQVQVNARLIDARTDRQEWAQSYRRELTAENLFDIQAEITKQIAGALETRLSPREQQQIERTPTEDLAAYRLFVHGREQLDQRTEDGMRRALDYFQRAIAADSSYALAWVGLADAWTLLVSYGYEAAERVLPRAERAVRRALELNPQSAEAHASLGLLHGVRLDGPASIRDLERAVELRPGYAEAHNWLSYGHLLQGNSAAALASARRAVELNPLSPEAVSNLSFSHLANGASEKALAEARRVTELQKSYSTGRFYEGLALYERGRFDEAQMVLRGLEVPWAGAGPRAALALSQLAAGDTTGALALFDRIEEADDRFATGLIHLALGEDALAFASFQRIDHWGDWPTLAVHHLYKDIWRPLQDDPRYEEMVRDVKRSRELEPGTDVNP